MAVLLIILTFTLSADQLLIKLMFTVSASQTKIDWGNINWVLIDEDEDEQGGENWRDVLAAYITYDESYLYLKLTTVSPPMFPTSPNDRDDDKYRWFIDLDGNMFWQGNVLYEAEYLLSIQDKNNDGVGEIYLLFDSDNDGEFDDELWESIAVNSTDGGFRIIGNHLEVYISWSKIGGMPSTLWLSWCTDRSDNNLNQCPSTDRAETSYGTVIRLGSIRGYKWEDLDGDGVWDNNEPPVTGWEIRLQSDSISLIDYTDINGCYQFLGLPDGSYIVSEAVQNGWIQTYPGNNSYIVQISSGMQFAGKNFGNFKLGVKGGYIWNDTNGNGLWDLDETALSNWEVNLYYLTNGSWEKIKMVYTNSSGFYELTNLEPGDYMVNVTVHSGYILTWPSGGFYSFSVRESGFNEVDNNFGFMKSMASISMIKSANTTFVHVGDTIKYSYKVINTGNAPLTIQYIDDDVIGRLVINEFLKPGEWIENIAIYNVTQNGPDPLMNKAVVYANFTDQQVSACDTLTIDVLNPNIEVSKSGPEYAHEGETITYTIIVKNAGDCILHNVVVKDEILGFEETIEELAKGEERTFIVTYTIPERSDDIINTVKAKGEDALGWEVSNSASWTVDVLHPAIDVIKRANATMIHVGDWIEYNVTVVNIGDCPLHDVSVEDTLIGPIFIGSLDVGEKKTFEVKYTVSCMWPEDYVTNKVYAEGYDGLDMRVSDEDYWAVFVLTPSIDVEKSGPQYAHEDDEITYIITVENTGNCELTCVTVFDDVLGNLTGYLPDITLDVGERNTITVAYKVPTPSEDITNTVTASGKDSLGMKVSDEDFWSIDILHPEISVEKTANVTKAYTGDVIEYEVNVTNVGDCPLYNVNITDSLLGIIWTGDLSVNESRIFNVTYTVMVGDPDPLNNTVTATGVDALGMSVSDEDSCVISVSQVPQTVVVIFNATGLSSDVSGVVVLSVDEGNYTCGELPRIFEWDVGSKHAFAWISPVNVSDGKRYIWTSTSGLSESQHGEITVPAGGGYVTGNYKIQYLVSFIQEGSAMPVNVEYQIDNGPVINCTIPFDTWLDSGVKISYNYSSIAYGDAGTRYILTEVDPTSPQIVNAPLTIDGKYKVQYYLEVVSAYGEPCPASGWFDAGTFINASVSSPWPVNAIGTRYVCTGWNGTGSVPPSGKEKSASFTINEPSSIIWNWKIQHYLEVQSSYGVTGGEGWYDENATAYASLNTGLIESDGTRHVFVKWADNATGTNYAKSDPIIMDAPKTATAIWKTQYYLTMKGDPSGAGTVSPSSSWYDADSRIQISATAASGYGFYRWIGSGLGSYSGTDNPAFITMYGPITETANFVQLTPTNKAIVKFSASGLDLNASGAVLIVDGVSYVYNQLPLSFTWDVGTSHSFAWLDPINSIVHGKRYIWSSTHGLSTAKNGFIVVPVEGGWVNATYKTQFYLTVISPYDTPSGEGWYDDGDEAYASLATGIVNLTSGMRAIFVGWSRDASGTDLLSEPIIMDAPKTAIANWVIQWLMDIEVTPEEAGSIPGEGWYNNCTTITFEAPEYLPSEEGIDGVRYRFVYWTVDGERFDGNVISVHANTSHTIISSYVIQCRVIFNQTGLDQSANETVVIVNGLAKKLEDLPFTLWIDVGNIVNYTYENFILSNIDGKKFELKSIIGPGSPVLVTEPVNITGNYQILYHLSVVSEYGSPRGSGWYAPNSEAKFGVTTPVDHGNRTLRVFLKWYGDVSIFEPEGIIVMNKPSIVISSWETQYLVTFNTTLPNKYILRVPGVPETLPPGMDIFGMYYPAGERITVGPAPITVPGAEGVRYTLAFWKLDGEILTYNVNMSFVVRGPHNIAVLYDTEYLLNVSAVGISDPFTATIIISSGTSIIRELKPTSPVKEWFRQGTQLAITTSTPNKIGHGEWAIFREWTGHLQTINRSIQFTMISPRTLNAVFFKVNPVAESIPYSIVAGLISMLLCIISARRSRRCRGRRRRSATSGIIVSAVALIFAAIVSVIIATGYGINVNELLDFTNWAVIFLILEAILFALITAAIVRRVQRQEKTSQET
ncbi:MAG: SdrD B-like domain-containing protein [Candidatus Bathyarchaeia archaeon]